MSHAINCYCGWFWLNCGWFPGDPFKLFCITLGEALEAYNSPKFDQITFLAIQVAYFTLAFGWQEKQ
jgi:hypothetical protein